MEELSEKTLSEVEKPEESKETQETQETQENKADELNIVSVKNKLSNIWAVKYMPTKIEDLACEEKIKTFLEDCLNNKNIPNHLCLYGTPGTGKNSIISILRNNIDAHWLIINASEENGIDDIRGKVMGFARSGILFDKPKILVMNEADGLTINAQNSMRELMEEQDSKCKFIFTCNDVDKIISPLQSRCTMYRVNPPMKEIYRVLARIIKAEKVQCTKEFLKLLVKIKGKDLRKLINSLQEFYTLYKGEKLTEEVLENRNLGLYDIFEKIFNSKDLNEIGSLIRETMLGEEVYTELAEYCIQGKFPSDAIVIIADSMYKSKFVYDKDILLMSCFLQIKALFKKK